MLGSQTQFPSVTGELQARLQAGAGRLKLAQELASAAVVVATAAMAARAVARMRNRIIVPPLLRGRGTARWAAVNLATSPEAVNGTLDPGPLSQLLKRASGPAREPSNCCAQASSSVACWLLLSDGSRTRATVTPTKR